MKKLNLSKAVKLLEGNGYFGFRGLNGIYGNAEYEENEILPCSLDDWEGRDIEYDENLEELDGTSAIGVNEYMSEKEIKAAYEKALNYSDCRKVILINGDGEEYGADEGETVLSYMGDGAKFLGQVIL
jgi:hypothetical protein